MYKIPELISVGFDGELGVRATTNPTFSYTTKTVTLQGGRVIDANGGEVVLPAVDGDFLETTVAVGGELSVTGDIQVQPYIHLSTVPALGDASIDIPVTVFAQTYSTPATKVAFPSVKVHIPLPNVRVPSEGVDLGDVKAGASGTASVTIRNSGEKAATMSFKSSDAQYDVPEGRITLAPKGTYELPIAFTSGSSGPTSADITVTSNDPDSPEQVFKVGANGAVTRGSARGAKDAADSADGCGCRNAGTTSPVGGWLGVGVLAVTAAAFARRRRSGA